jgi:hypothetical protein
MADFRGLAKPAHASLADVQNWRNDKAARHGRPVANRPAGGEPSETGPDEASALREWRYESTGPENGDHRFVIGARHEFCSDFRAYAHLRERAAQKPGSASLVERRVEMQVL